jgi:hypothetical protein
MSSFSTAVASAQAPAQETQGSAIPEEPSPRRVLSRDPYRGAILVLLAAAFLGALSAATGGWLLGNLILLDVAVTLGISTGVLAGVAVAQNERAKPPKPKVSDEVSAPPAPIETTVERDTQATTEITAPVVEDSNAKRRPLKAVFDIGRQLRDLEGPELITRVRIGTGAAGLAAIGLMLLANLSTLALPTLVAAIAAAVCFIGAGLAATAVRYLADLKPALLPEAPGLCRGARVLAWILVLAGLSMALHGRTSRP